MKHLREITVDDEKRPLPIGEEAIELERTWQILTRVLRFYDEQGGKIGGQVFPSVDNCRELMEPTEANRVIKEYMTYVKAEHSEVLGDETFRDAEEPVKRMVAGKSR